MADGRRVAFVYPGQGAQRVGMGAELRETHPEVFDRYFGLAERVSELPLTRYSLEGPPESLTRTDVAQPALFALSLALTELACELGVTPDLVAGHSLGEYSAAVASSALKLEDGMRLVAKRGRLMQDAHSMRPGGMAAVRGVGADEINRLCRAASGGGVVQVANLNSPRQTVVSGDDDAVTRLVELVSDRDDARAMRLRVGAAFHSELMRPVQAELAVAIEATTFRDATVPLVANCSGRAIREAPEVREALVRQVASPVRWMECVRTMSDGGCRTMIELGPAKVLSTIARDIDPALETLPVGSPAQLGELLAVTEPAG